MNRWEKVAVIGAAGKMGRGIALILLQEMARLDAEENESVGKNNFRLYLIDKDEEGVFSLRQYFRTHLTRYAEKSINQIRSYFCNRNDLIENGQIIHEFVEGALDIVRPSVDLKTAKNSLLIFEAAVEDIKIKESILSELKDLCLDEAYFFTNTSSIPIGELAANSGLDGQLAGAHFYNPPSVQKLLEIIYPDDASAELKELTLEIGKALGKITVVSRDVAGFIGNGHFIREIAFASDLYEKLKKDYTHVEAIVMVDMITRDYLIRPMGIFQLLDYVGLDVWKKIATIMTEKVPLKGVIKPLLNEMVEKGKIGGQELDGAQKEGFFRYQKNKITDVFDIETGTYEPLDDEKIKHIKSLIGPFPEGHIPWKKALGLKNREEKLKTYEKALRETSVIAAQFLDHSRKAAKELVDSGVAASLEDVETVLKNGFYHVLV